MLLYLDTCSIQRPFDDQSQIRIFVEAEAVLRLIDLAEQGVVDLLSSEPLLLETAKNPYPLRRRFGFEVLSLAARVVKATRKIEALAKGYREIGVSPLVALHLASAVEAGSEVFCTTDDRLYKAGQEAPTRSTRVLTPLETLEELEA